MSLKLRPTGLSSGIDKDRRTTSSALAAGILAASTRPVAAPENMRWFWSLTINGPVTRADRVATLEEAKRSSRRAGTRGRRGRSWRRSPALGIDMGFENR
jgi:hypothetical protein